LIKRYIHTEYNESLIYIFIKERHVLPGYKRNISHHCFIYYFIFHYIYLKKQLQPEWAIEWLIFNTKWAISWRGQVTFRWFNDDVRIVLDQKRLAGFFNVIVHRSNSPLVDMLTTRTHYPESMPTSLGCVTL
jgi:hypothetical protein